MINETHGRKNFGRVILAGILTVAAFPLHARAGGALEQLSLASGGIDPAVISRPSLAISPAAAAGIRILPSRFPAGGHSAFATLDSSYKEDAKYGDYYPFAGDHEGRYLDEQGQPTIVSGLLGGMVDESGHGGVFANGGDPKAYWERALKRFRNREFAEAYHDIGIMCHLTQDQAAPAHAANINHVITFGDKFEGFTGKNISMLARITGDVEAMRPASMQPYEYYQALQDDTRKQLAGWTDPKTTLPYWPPAPDAPPLGQDATNGPWSHYSNGKDSYDKNVSPEILDRQLLMAAIYTREVLKAAAKLLPPTIGRRDSLRRVDDPGSPVDVSFGVYDNRRGKIKLTVERPLYGQVEQAVIDIVSDGSTVPNGSLTVTFNTPSHIIKGRDVIFITAEDADGNICKVSTKIVYNAPPDYSAGG